ncbi:MAG TPA: hypothetical protein VKZ53_14640 [Candidatus Angelobacter sp.]|nr:hypothetical protein [Candidatus Angelobacter sp.]
MFSLLMRVASKTPLIVAVAISFLLGCTGQPAPSPQLAEQTNRPKPLTAPPEVTSEEEEGFHDLVLYAQDCKRLPDGSQTIRGLGTFKGRKLGIAIVLGPAWKAGSVNKDLPLITYQGNVAFRATGADSNALIQVLDELYGTKVNPKAMAKETQFTAISLEGDPRDLAKGLVKIKLFFESGERDDYAELFTNIDLADHRLEIREKDQEYRLPVVKALQVH